MPSRNRGFDFRSVALAHAAYVHHVLLIAAIPGASKRGAREFVSVVNHVAMPARADAHGAVIEALINEDIGVSVGAAVVQVAVRTSRDGPCSRIINRQ
jgi:hypothetical protein